MHTYTNTYASPILSGLFVVVVFLRGRLFKATFIELEKEAAQARFTMREWGHFGQVKAT